MDQITRGDVIRFTANFTDETGASIIPASANLFLNYVTASDRTSVTIAMVMADSNFTADWESDVAFPGIVYWSAQATTPHAAEDGSFELIANKANPNP